MDLRKLSEVRTYLKRATMRFGLVSEIRVIKQVMDLQLIKAAIKTQGLYEPDIEQCIDVCTAGFIWLYQNGGTHDKLPAVIKEDAEAKEYYDNFMAAWSTLQEFMRTNMYLMEV